MNDQVRVLSRALNTPDLRFFFFGSLYPKALDSRNVIPIFVRISFEKELIAQAALFRVLADKLNEFIVFEKHFNLALFSGSYKEALAVLAEVREKIGVSLWYFENLLITLKFNGQEEELRSVVNEVTHTKENAWTLKVLMVHQWEKLDKNSSPKRSLQSLKDLLRSLDFGEEDPYWELLKYRALHREIAPSPTELEKMLWIDGTLSLPDRYLNFIQVCSNAYSIIDEQPELAEVLQECFKQLYGRVSDSRISSLAEGLGLAINEAPDPTNISPALDAYTRGNYKDCLGFCAQHKEHTGFDELHVLSARASSRLSEKASKGLSLNARLIHLISDLVDKGPNYEMAAAELEKIILQFGRHPWALFLAAVLRRETNPLDQQQHKRLLALEFVFMDLNNPWRLLGITNDSARQKLAYRLSKHGISGPTFRLMNALSQNTNQTTDTIELDSEIDFYRKQTYIGNWLLHSGNLPEAATRFRSLLQATDELSRQSGAVGLVYCQFKQNLLAECLALIVDRFLSGNSLFVRVPLKDILAAVLESGSLSLRGHLNFAICCSIYAMQGGMDGDQVLADAFEDYLEQERIGVPSELRTRIGDLADPGLRYFLREICVPRVMHGTRPFKSTDAVLHERIQICRILLEQDHDRAADYSEEIKTLTQAIIVRQALKEAEESKIFVNKEGILRTLEPTLKEDFERARELQLKHGSENSVILLVNLASKEREREKDKEGDKEVVRIVFNQPLARLEVLFLKLRDRFIASNQFGLDTYLGARIRHGALGGHLRRPLQLQHLITEIDARGEYAANTYWRDRFNNLPDLQVAAVLTALQQFSQSVDELIAEVNERWLQIRTESTETSGLFDYSLNRITIMPHLIQLQKASTFEEFFENAFEILWQSTDAALTNVRARIDSELRTRILGALNQLSNVVQQELGSIGSDLNDSIALAQTNLQNELERISNWFKRPTVTESPAYPVSLLFDIAQAYVRNLYPNASPRVETEVEDNIHLQGYTRQSLVDVVTILMDNVVEHSGLSNATVKLSAKKESGFLCLTCTNNVASWVFESETSVTEYNDRLDPLRNDIRDESGMLYASKEGRSGFHKIRRIVETDLRSSCEMTFVAIEGGLFCVTLRIDDGLLQP